MDKKDKVLRLTLKEYNRIYDQTILREKSSISKEIVDKLSEILNKILVESDNEVKNNLIDVFFGTSVLKNKYNEFNYKEFLKIAIEKKDKSRFRLIYLISQLLNNNILNVQKLNIKIINAILKNTLFEINNLVISFNDLELFKMELNAFKSSFLIESPSKIQSNIINNLHHAENLLSYYNPDINEKRGYIEFLIKFRLTKDYNFTNDLFKYLNELKEEIIDEIQKNTENDNETKKQLKVIFERKHQNSGIIFQLYDYIVSFILYRTFFMIGAYILSENRKNTIDGSVYINELWVQGPVESDILRLMNIYLYGGINNELWDVLGYTLETFGEIKDYKIQYFILCLIKFYDSSQKLLSYNKNCIDEIEGYYGLINRFLLEKDEIIRNVDILNKESKKWSQISKKEIENKLKITIFDQNNIFEAAKLLINSFFDELLILKTELELLIPLDEKKVERAKELLLETYTEDSSLPELIEYQTYDEIEQPERLPPYTKIAFRPLYPKNCLIKTADIDCDIIWHDISKKIVIGEEKHCLKRFLKDKNIERSSLKEPTILEIYKKIEETCKKLSEEGFVPTLIFIPQDILDKLRSESAKSENPLSRKIIRNRFLKIDENLKLRLFNSNIYLNFKEIILINTESINWVYKLDNRTNQRLWIDINEYEEEKSKVDVCVRSKINIEIENPNGIKILELAH